MKCTWILGMRCQSPYSTDNLPTDPLVEYLIHQFVFGDSQALTPLAILPVSAGCYNTPSVAIHFFVIRVYMVASCEY